MIVNQLLAPDYLTNGKVPKVAWVTSKDHRYEIYDITSSNLPNWNKSQFEELYCPIILFIQSAVVWQMIKRTVPTNAEEEEDQ